MTLSREGTLRRSPWGMGGRRGVLFFLTLLVLLSCAGRPALRESSPQAGLLIEGVPFYPQEAYQCGPASLAGVLNFWGVGAAPEDVAREIFSRSARGTLGMDMVLFAQDRGLKARSYSGGAEDLRRQIDAGLPVVVMVDYGFWLYQKNHFMVIVGYGEGGFIANSGRDRHKFLPEDEFLRSWERAGYWTLVLEGG
ncbi:MAG: hypothetical protein Kow0025_05950 [Thermodesulfovibrionales bacterium]